MFITSHQIQRSVMGTHDLSGKAQAYSRAILFGSEERNEDLLLTLW